MLGLPSAGFEGKFSRKKAIVVFHLKSKIEN